MNRAEPQQVRFDEVLTGLCQPIKQLPCKLLYDAAGAELFERITEVEDYYLTRAEHALLAAELPAIAKIVGPHARVIEPGSGAGKKTRMLLGALDRVATYVPIDVSADQLADNAAALRSEFPGLEVLPVLGDYTQPIEVPASARRHERTVVFFPGSTIGNFEPEAARRFLASLAALAGPNAMLLLGADANANRDELLRAYDDSEGVTAEFDLNVLAHVNRTHGASFDLDQFMHRAVWNAARSRIEMHLVSKRAQTVTVAGATFTFARGEPIVTEHCYKHSPEALAQILRDSGWTVAHTFADPGRRMRLWLATGVPPKRSWAT
ncbi:MAG TPA: L-histidine N(alpha)-methyltransferase [Kofleriaceae bacterium]|nr:L-histidine N(alpha)-methyltransferase [Kofleriaceae bacterium]